MQLSVTPIGVGDAFTAQGAQTNYLVELDGAVVLIDCGTTAAAALETIGKQIIDIDAVYVSHLHLDHVGGLIQLGIVRHFTKRVPPTVYLHRSLYPAIWDNFLSGLMRQYIDADGKPQIASPETFFRFVPVDSTFKNGGAPIKQGRLTLRLIEVPHEMGRSTHGVLINDKVFITTDTSFAPELLQELDKHYQLLQIFHDCSFNDSDSTRFVHATYQQLKTLPETLRERLILTHYEDWVSARKTQESEVGLVLGVAGNGYKFEI